MQPSRQACSQPTMHQSGVQRISPPPAAQTSVRRAGVGRRGGQPATLHDLIRVRQVRSCCLYCMHAMLAATETRRVRPRSKVRVAETSLGCCCTHAGARALFLCFSLVRMRNAHDRCSSCQIRHGYILLLRNSIIQLYLPPHPFSVYRTKHSGYMVSSSTPSVSDSTASLLPTPSLQLSQRRQLACRSDLSYAYTHLSNRALSPLLSDGSSYGHR